VNVQEIKLTQMTKASGWAAKLPQVIYAHKILISKKLKSLLKWELSMKGITIIINFHSDLLENGLILLYKRSNSEIF